jgi:hypothetical protein
MKTTPVVGLVVALYPCPGDLSGGGAFVQE